MRASGVSVVLGLGFALAGCATSEPMPGGKTWSDGWRKGVVTSIQDELRWFQSPCGKAAEPGQKYVTVNYRVSNKPRWKFIAVPAAGVPAPNAKVLLNVNSCEFVPNA